MAVTTFTVENIDLTLSFSTVVGQNGNAPITDYDKIRPQNFTPEYDPEGKLHAKLYKVSGADGTTRTLSMAGLVMSVCLARATELEAEIIRIMAEIEATSDKLEELTEFEELIINGTKNSDGTMRIEYTHSTVDYYALAAELGLERGSTSSTGSTSSLNSDGESTVIYFGDFTLTNPDDAIQTIESKMDSLNSFSQETMIDLQSRTNKRDQAYDMVANILKSLNGVQIGIANNL